MILHQQATRERRVCTHQPDDQRREAAGKGRGHGLSVTPRCLPKHHGPGRRTQGEAASSLQRASGHDDEGDGDSDDEAEG